MYRIANITENSMNRPQVKVKINGETASFYIYNEEDWKGEDVGLVKFNPQDQYCFFICANKIENVVMQKEN